MERGTPWYFDPTRVMVGLSDGHRGLAVGFMEYLNGYQYSQRTVMNYVRVVCAFLKANPSIEDPFLALNAHPEAVDAFERETRWYNAGQHITPLRRAMDWRCGVCTRPFIAALPTFPKPGSSGRYEAALVKRGPMPEPRLLLRGAYARPRVVSAADAVAVPTTGARVVVAASGKLVIRFSGVGPTAVIAVPAATSVAVPCAAKVVDVPKALQAVVEVVVPVIDFGTHRLKDALHKRECVLERKREGGPTRRTRSGRRYTPY